MKTVEDGFEIAFINNHVQPFGVILLFLLAHHAAFLTRILLLSNSYWSLKKIYAVFFLDRLANSLYRKASNLISRPFRRDAYSLQIKLS